MNLYYLGPRGTFSYLASKKYLTETEADYHPKSNLYEVVQAVQNDSDSIGIVPIENSIEGTINIIADGLAHQNIYAIGEIHLNIQFGLYALAGTPIEAIDTVYSISPAISQTNQFIQRHQFQIGYSESTVQSLDFIDEHTGAIAPLGINEDHRLEAIEQNIEDFPHNVTRFLIIGNHLTIAEDATDTVLMITPEQDRAGLLANILNTFAIFNINLSWIESRPLKTQLGRYRFFVQADATLNSELDKVIKILETLDYQVKIIGSFKKQTK
ncbi:prephenate dehydratase domain-containing protein [Staphylococcus simulans]|uniref:prephenate dehydratase n=1 Tax=Staphylococcus simulans TaxID=1286 RepID=UPI00280BF035|nr:prephenate dehydratase domain-containing protein [Staphylococcus simulans]WMM10448.1 prephenate dehydratase domain-containing protein [Staphylococcus simulans]